MSPPPAARLAAGALLAGLLLAATASPAAAGRMPLEMTATDPDRSSLPTALDAYYAAFDEDVPYIKNYQPVGLTYKFQFWRNKASGMQKMVRNGVETTITRLDLGREYVITVFNNGERCVASKKETTDTLADVLPDLSNAEEWAFIGKEEVNGESAMHFQQTVAMVYGFGNYTFHYNFFTTQAAPLKLDSMGTNFYGGSHYDNYVATFSDFEAGEPDASVFDLPKSCDGVEPAAALLDGAASAYHAFAAETGRNHADKAEFHARMAQFAEHHEMISSWDHAAKGFSLEVNHFADMLPHEMAALRRRKAKGPQLGAFPFPGARNYTQQQPFHLLPATLDYRGTILDSPVKDQASCGSCWTFGTVASIETAYARQTGRQQLFSEQALLDCVFNCDDSGCNEGCGGGFQDTAYNYMLANKQPVIQTEEEYPYEGIGNKCRVDNATESPVKLKEWVQVNARGNPDLLKEALLFYGPMTVALDAKPKDLYFYKEGIFHSPECKTAADTLDHVVIVSGYGRSPEGVDYWIVKNTWSANWGQDGYVYIAIDPPQKDGDVNNDCGIGTQAIFVQLTIEGGEKLAARTAHEVALEAAAVSIA
eukprot:jgi/Tetstr1/439460/TSEL_027893.t1